MRRRRGRLVALSCIALAAGVDLHAQATATLVSYQRARAVVDRALAAHGADSASEIDDLTLAYDGDRHMRYQSFTPDRWDTQRTNWRTVIDFRESRMRRDFVERYPADFEFAGRQYTRPRVVSGSTQRAPAWATL